MIKAIVIIKHAETELLAEGMHESGLFDVKKFYLNADLPDVRSIVWDEITIDRELVICDSYETSTIAQTCPINNAMFMLLDLSDKLDEEERLFLRTRDFHRIEVKDYGDKTKNDWKEAAILLGKQVSESINSCSYLRT